MTQSVHVMWIDCGIELFIDPWNIPRGYSCIVLIEHHRSQCKLMEVHINLLLLPEVSVMKLAISM